MGKSVLKSNGFGEAHHLAIYAMNWMKAGSGVVVKS
jgi:hypothetical protein